MVPSKGPATPTIASVRAFGNSSFNSNPCADEWDEGGRPTRNHLLAGGQCSATFMESQPPGQTPPRNATRTPWNGAMDNTMLPAELARSSRELGKFPWILKEFEKR